MSNSNSTDAISVGIVTSGVPADPTMRRAALELSRAHGGYWGEHPAFSSATWREEVETEQTRQGYWEWALARELQQLCSDVATAEDSHFVRP